MSDQVANAIKVTVLGTYDADDMTITLSEGHGAELPDPAGDNYNLPWWDSTNYGDPVDDPNFEIVRVTAVAGDVITVTRAQEGTGASTKSTPAATYKMVMGVTAKTITDLIAETDVVGAGLTLHMSDTSTHGAAEVADVATVSAEIDSDISTHATDGDAHHAEAHSIASHNDTTATGAELEDLTDGSDADTLHAHGANDTHRTSDGSDHTYVDQSVVSGASPAFLGTNITAIPAVNLEFNVIGTPTYKDAQDWFDIVQSAGIIAGFVMSNSREPTELDVSAGKGLVKIIDSDIGGTVSFETSAVENVTLTADNINYIYVDYNAGTPQIVATTDRSAIELNRHFVLGRVYKNGVTLHILNAGVHVPNLTRTEYERLVERDGFTHASGVIVTETGSLNLAITAGVWFMGHNRVTTDAFDSSDTDTCVYTHYGAASWITDNAAATAVDCTHYNDGTDVLASLGSNNYSSQWIYITTDSHIYIIYGTENGTLTVATDAIPPTSLPKYVETMGELIAKMIVKQSGEIISIAMVHDVKFTAVGVPNHNDLGGLQGGAANDYYHLTSAEITDLTDAGDSTAHYHATDRARADHTGTQASSTVTVLATARILGRKTAGAGVIEELTAADVLTMISVESGADVTDAVNVASSIVGVDDKAIPVDADSIGVIDSAAANVLKELTWANVKATLKTYFDTLYNLYVHPNHSGDVTSVADGAQTIVADAVTYAKMQDISGGDRILGRSTAGGGIIEEVTCTAVARAFLDDPNVATQRDTLDVDQAGTDNSINVTLDGTPDYITIVGQVITRSQVDLAADVTGKLPYANIQNVVNDERILGRVSGANGVIEELTAADVLTMISVESGADVTDATNVESAGAVMNADKDVANGVVGLDASSNVDITGNVQGSVLNNLNAVDFGERILGLMTSPVFLNTLCEDPGAGTLTDISGNDHDGTYTGTWATAQRLKQGRTWKLNPNGSDNYIMFGDHNDFSFGDGSNDSIVTFFGMIEVALDTVHRGIFSKWDETTGTEAREYLIYLRDAEKIQHNMSDESANVDCNRVTDAALSAGNHSFVVTYDGAGGATAANTIKIYIDGALVASTATNNGAYVAMENLATPLWIGGWEQSDGTPGDLIQDDFGCLGIDASEWTAAKAWRFHQLCLAAYSEDGITL